MVWEDIHFFSVRNSSANKTEGGDGSFWWGKFSPDSTVWVVLATHFSSDSVWCKCCNAGLQLIFKVKTLGVLFCKYNEHVTHVWKKLSFFVGVSSAWTSVVVFWFVPLNPRLITCDCLWQKFLASFKALLNVLALLEKILLLLLLLLFKQQVGHEFCNTTTHIYIIIKIFLKWQKRNCQHFSSFRIVILLSPSTNYFTRSTSWSVLFTCGRPEPSTSSTEITPLSNLENYSNTFFICPPLPSFKQNLIQTRCSFKYTIL
jgi:hypothetical protein